MMVAGWQDEGMCRGRYADLFFAPHAFEPKEDRLRREARATAICRVCPVLEPCADHALSIGEPFGIWGGMTELDRHRQLVS
ncbi:MAG: WhiB family transcriptional regulator [Acidimicrobiia bacterium]